MQSFDLDDALIVNENCTRVDYYKWLFLETDKIILCKKSDNAGHKVRHQDQT